MNHPLIIIETQYTFAIYLNGQRYISQITLMPKDWIKIGMIIREMNITDVNYIKKVYLTEDEVSSTELLWNFPERVEYLHQDIIKVLNEHN